MKKVLGEMRRVADSTNKTDDLPVVVVAYNKPNKIIRSSDNASPLKIRYDLTLPIVRSLWR